VPVLAPPLGSSGGLVGLSLTSSRLLRSMDNQMRGSPKANEWAGPHGACRLWLRPRDSEKWAVGLPLSGERSDPRESTAVPLIRPDGLLGHLGVQGRPQVSTTVVSTALAAGCYIWRLLTFRSRGGESILRDHSPLRVSHARFAGAGLFVPKPTCKVVCQHP
jgi:hypothetical protein